jgi:glycosyltransferase involved in cell wall biosynthesis
MRGARLSVAYVHYGAQSGVTASVARALMDRGHDVRLVAATGDLELRDPVTQRPRATPRAVLNLAASAARFGLGRRALEHRINTGYAFDHHSRTAGAALDALRPAPGIVLQNGALFSPGLPPSHPYALLCDHTRALAQASPEWPQVGLGRPPDYGAGWFEREGAAYRGASVIGCFSVNVARSLMRDYGVDPARVRVVGAGANVFPAQAPRRDDGRTVLFVGRDFARKGGPVLVDAFVRLRGRMPKARLLVAGARAAPRDIPEGVFFLGPVGLDELPALFSQATVFALPTLVEPYGIAFLDAMACGVPCVGTRIEAVPEIIREGETGLLVPPADPVALALALEQLLSDPARARAMGARGRARVFAGGLWSHVGARLERALAAAVGPPSPVNRSRGTRPLRAG